MIFLTFLVCFTLYWDPTLSARQADVADRKSRVEKRTDDVSIGALEGLVQQQARVMQELQARQGALKNRMAALETENAALKTQLAGVQGTIGKLSTSVAFTVRFVADNAADGVAIGPHSILRFDDIIYNTGNGYDPHTGIFTAPLAGSFSFFLNHMGAGSHGDVYLSIVKNGGIVDIAFSHHHEDQGSSQVTTHLKAGEKVWVQQNAGNAVRGGWYTVFTGYLLHAD
ncbi:hypothetical protein ACOMHN_021956 [Nucella lapillus]